MKIAISAFCQNVDKPSGLLSYFLQIAKFAPLRDRAAEYFLFCGKDDVAYYQERCPDLRVVGIGWSNRNRGLRVLTENFLLDGALRRHGIDVLYHAGTGIAPLLLSRRIKLALGIFGMHHLAAGQISWAQRTYRSTLFGRGLKRADMCIMNSAYSRDLLLQHYGQVPGKLALVHHGFDGNLFNDTPVGGAEAAALAAFGVQLPYVLFVGQMYPYKMAHILVEAYCRVMKATGLPHQLVIVGSFADVHGMGPQYRQTILDMMAAAGLSERLVLVSGISVKALRAAYAGADVYVQSSAAETFGRTVLEAMACGTPVLAAHAGATPEVLGDAGVYYETESVEGCAENLERLLTNPQERAAWAAKGLERAKLFTFEAEVEALTRLFHRCRD